MGSDDWPDWLPVDWTVTIRKIDGRTVKCFVDSEGHTCYSKPEVLDYLKKTNKSTDNAKTQNADDSTIDLSVDPNARPTKLTPRTSRRKSHSRHDENLTLSMEDLNTPCPSNVTETPKEVPNGVAEEPKTNESGVVEEPKTNESDIHNPKPIRSISGGVFNNTPNNEKSDWLPDGWIVEDHYKSSGVKFKVFKEAASGKKFYSKPQVLNYLGGGSSSYSGKRKVITTSAADGLPPGWIKEVRTKIYATHKRSDPFYTDPVTGYIFRSKMDAMRFLDTGDVNLCAIRPKVKDKDGKEVFVYANGEQKPEKPATGKGLSDDTVDGKSTDNHEENQTTPDNTKHKSPAKNKKNSDPAASASTPARSSKRQRGMNPGAGPTSAGASDGNGSGQVKQASWVNLEKQPADDGNLAYDIPEDDTWTDQCIDFAVKTLANEILFNGQPMSGGFQEDKNNNETPTKVK
ncbi:hypothetical protein M8C21_028031 [Ambrosia artemisiifolia]|uniref:MBD domain-containing protein n=1 Tax=Ambrosia artemisiifolia TaxID=4212 RepID=A0AAD5CDH0_AMBAR|nr:hypothetical protein M8C21_028031 [Ambrosia artemisiifolia]